MEKPLTGSWHAGDLRREVELSWDDTETESIARLALNCRNYHEHRGQRVTGNIRIEIDGERKAEVVFEDGRIEHLKKYVGGRLRFIHYHMRINERGRDDVTIVRQEGYPT